MPSKKMHGCRWKGCCLSREPNLPALKIIKYLHCNQENRRIPDIHSKLKYKVKQIGFAGHPPDEILTRLKTAHPGAVFIDLDEPASNLSLADTHLPRVYCAILRSILANAISTKLDLIVASTGECKCDGMRYLANILREILPVPVLDTKNSSVIRCGNPISVSPLPLRRKMELIVDGIINIKNHKLKECQPAVGFWGVPPHDFDLLDLFPDNTHIFGWTRCLENRTPADLKLEMFVEPDLPTVFFSQSFCQKNGLSQYLAGKYNGLYLEVDDKLSSSGRAKLEAFLELRAGITLSCTQIF